MDDQTKILLEAMFQRYGRPSEVAEPHSRPTIKCCHMGKK